MSEKPGKQKKANKGLPSAVVISILIHVGLFLLAGVLVVFTVVKTEKIIFKPTEQAENPKVEIVRPRVKPGKPSKPQSLPRIASRESEQSMPDLQLPGISGLGDSVGDDLGGIDYMLPPLDKIKIFGDEDSIGNDFAGKFYDFKRSRDGQLLVPSTTAFKEAVGKFTRGDWDTAHLRKYYCSTQELHTTAFMVPISLSSLAPSAFGEADTQGYCWLAHYKGDLVHREGITFRFWGHGDDILLVRVDGEIVLNASWPGTEQVYSKWTNVTADNRKYFLGSQRAVVGNWITLEPRVPLDMEVVIGEVPGGVFCAMLLVEVKGVEYERNRQNGPILPVFKTEHLSRDLIDEISTLMYEGEASLTNGPVFKDYGPVKDGATNTVQGSEADVYEGEASLTNGPVSKEHATVQDVATNTVQVNEADVALATQSKTSDSPLRTWTGEDGQSFKAQLITVMNTYALLESEDGKQRKIPIARLSEADRAFVELANPPRFTIDFSRKSQQRMMKMSPYSGRELPQVVDMTFGVKMKQTGAGLYHHELHVEYFAIGKEVAGDNYILLERNESRFIPSEENERSHEFYGRQVKLMNYNLANQRHGKKYDGYLATVTDERGEIIQYNTSNEWLFDNLENLKGLPVGSFMDKTCTRVLPTYPKTDRY